jgi:hypothetical protein
MVSVLDTGPKIRGYKPGRGDGCDKNPQHTFLRQRSKAEGPVDIIIINNSVAKLITNKQSVQWRREHPLIGVYILLPLQDDSEDQDYYFPLTLYDYISLQYTASSLLP